MDVATTLSNLRVWPPTGVASRFPPDRQRGSEVFRTDLLQLIHGERDQHELREFLEQCRLR